MAGDRPDSGRLGSGDLAADAEPGGEVAVPRMGGGGRVGRPGRDAEAW